MSKKSTFTLSFASAIPSFDNVPRTLRECLSAPFGRKTHDKISVSDMIKAGIRTMTHSTYAEEHQKVLVLASTNHVKGDVVVIMGDNVRLLSVECDVLFVIGKNIHIEDTKVKSYATIYDTGVFTGVSYSAYLTHINGKMSIKNPTKDMVIFDTSFDMVPSADDIKTMRNYPKWKVWSNKTDNPSGMKGEYDVVIEEQSAVWTAFDEWDPEEDEAEATTEAPAEEVVEEAVVESEPIVIEEVIPVEPVQPVQPVEPVKPVEPIQPVEPVPPVEPVKELTVTVIPESAGVETGFSKQDAQTLLKDLGNLPSADLKMVLDEFSVLRSNNKAEMVRLLKAVACVRTDIAYRAMEVIAQHKAKVEAETEAPTEATDESVE